MSDLIDRQRAINVLEILSDKMSEEGQTVMGQAIAVLKDLADAEWHGVNEWCTDCKEYDKDKHCCPRWNRVIKRAIDEVRKNAEPERKMGKWKKIGHWGRHYRCDQCGNTLDFDGVNAGRGDANFCPNCGADLRGE